MTKISALMLIAVFSINAAAQKTDIKKSVESSKSSAKKSADRLPLDIARSALAAHGGDKFKNMKTLVVRGKADISGSPTMVIPASFFMVIAGERYRIEIENPLQPFKQSFDGVETRSSVNNLMLPPINRLGLPLLQKIDAADFKVSVLPEKYAKKRGFRITSPEGFYTDFFTDEKTDRIKSYEASYDYNGRTISTSVEIDKFLDVKGVLIPERYAQRFEVGQLTIYAAFKALEILVDTELADDVFTISR